MVNSAPLSWHIPTISAFERLDPAEVLHVVFLQRTASDERSEVVQALGKADEDVLQQLDIPEQTTVRRIVQRRWIRDYWPSSAAILTIAERAHIPYRRNGPTQDPSYSSVVFADSGWESGNVIAAHWEQSGEEWLLAAARVKIGLANLLLTACDAIEGMTMSQALGPDTYQELMIDLYKDLPTKPLVPRICFTPSVELPSHLPQGLATDTLQPILISLRSLDTETMAQLRREITEGSQDIPAPNVQIYNWEGPEPTDPLVRTSSGETPNGMAAFFVDYLHQGPNGEPRIVACIDQSHGTESNTVLVPVYTATFLEACKAAAIKVGIEQENGLVDQWQREEFEDLNVAVLDIRSSCPVFFLQPFSQEEERTIRAALAVQDEYNDFGNDFQYFGYPFQDREKHTLEDLRDLFETAIQCPPWPYTLRTYPSDFVAIDDAILDTEQPKLWLLSSMDFHGEDTTDQLGWEYGTVDPQDASNDWINLNIANMGHEELIDGPSKQLWLSDLKAYQAEDWPNEDPAEQ